jgi:hypothetical protein
MSKSKSRKKKSPSESPPDLAQAKTAVLNSLASSAGQWTYEHAI